MWRARQRRFLLNGHSCFTISVIGMVIFLCVLFYIYICQRCHQVLWPKKGGPGKTACNTQMILAIFSTYLQKCPSKKLFYSKLLKPKCLYIYVCTRTYLQVLSDCLGHSSMGILSSNFLIL